MTVLNTIDLDDLPAADGLAMEMDNWANEWRIFVGALHDNPADYSYVSKYPLSLTNILHVTGDNGRVREICLCYDDSNPT